MLCYNILSSCWITITYIDLPGRALSPLILCELSNTQIKPLPWHKSWRVFVYLRTVCTIAAGQGIHLCWVLLDLVLLYNFTSVQIPNSMKTCYKQLLLSPSFLGHSQAFADIFPGRDVLLPWPFLRISLVWQHNLCGDANLPHSWPQQDSVWNLHPPGNNGSVGNNITFKFLFCLSS